MDDCFGVWKGTRRQLESFIKEMNDEQKGIILEKEIEEDGVLNFLDMRITRTREGKFVTSWFQKDCAAGIYCHKRSDVDEGTKVNFIRNMEERINMINMEEGQKEKDLERLWEQLKGNGYGDQDRKRSTRKRKENKEK